jgi:prepilin-type processing-associated H-X9-DG protein
LLVVVGIVAVLLAIFLPALNKARAHAARLKCMANLRVLGQMVFIYENDNRGWIYPVGPPEYPGDPPTTLGDNVPPHERWPMKMFKFRYPWPPPYNSAAYSTPKGREAIEAQMLEYPAAPYTPPVLLCPSDVEPYEAHSYVLNKHLADNFIKASKKNFGGLSATQVVIAGEKISSSRDYYVEATPSPDSPRSEYHRVVDKYRHGAKLGSNYLYFDGHVDSAMPEAAARGIDPWDLPH